MAVQNDAFVLLYATASLRLAFKLLFDGLIAYLKWEAWLLTIN